MSFALVKKSSYRLTRRILRFELILVLYRKLSFN